MELKIAFFIIVISVSNVLATPGYSQVAKVSIDMEDKSLEQVMDEIERQSEFYFIFNQKHIDVNRVVDIQVENKLITDILPELFKGTNVNYAVFDRKILLTTAPLENNLLAIASGTEFQQRIVTGKVTDTQTGEIMPGVNVVVKGTTSGVITDTEGKYSLNLPNKDATLIFSFIGYRTQEIPIAGKTTIDATLVAEVMGLEEVVIIGYGVQKKATVTGSVTSIGTGELVQSPTANIGNTLLGRISGLTGIQQQGQPGSDQDAIRIRGTGTFAGGSDPLVISGASNPVSPLIMIDGIESLNYNNLDPNEIANISILKDASATAVYGVRGANGVLLITTKRGSKGAPVFSFSQNLAVSSFTELRKNLGSLEWAQTFNEGLRYNSYFTGTYIPKFSDSDLEHYRTGDSPIFYPNTDWISLVFKPITLNSQTNLNVSGGSDAIKYFVNLGYFDQGGLYNDATLRVGDNFDRQISFHRYNFRSNFDFNITKRFSANVNLSSQIEERIGPSLNSQVAGTLDLIGKTYQAPPNMSPGIVDGKVINVYQIFGGNPLELLSGKGYNHSISNYLTSSVRFNYDLDQITKGLTVHGTISYWNYMTNNKSYSRALMTYKPLLSADNTIVYAPEKEEQPFSFGESTGKNRKTYFEFGFDYARKFGVHNFTALILYNQSKLYDPGLTYVVPNGYQGLIGRITYDYSGRYLAEFDAGYNGTENFAPGKRFGFFPAYSLGWVVSQEPFFPKNSIISFAKLRGSYGEVGNDKIGGTRFLYLPTAYTYTGTLSFGEVGSTYQSYPAAAEGVLGNPNLTWERAKKSNIGIDLTLWKDKIKITADWFVERRDNILTSPGTTPNLVGKTLPALNMGKMKNSGYESEIAYNSKIGNFNYWIKANYTYAHNVILFQDEVKRPFIYENRTGQSVGQNYGLIIEGFYNTWQEVNNANRPKSSWQNNYIMPGDFRYKDVNGDGIINSDDMVPIGYPAFPEINYGVSFGGGYKGFDFSVLFQGVRNSSRMGAISTDLRPFDSDRACRAYIPGLSWSQDRYEQGLPITLPHLSAQAVQVYDFQTNTFTLQNRNYVRLKNAEIGYTFSTAFLKKMNITSCRVYANCNNLITWSGMLPGIDPEQVTQGDEHSYPITRTLNLGVNIKF